MEITGMAYDFVASFPRSELYNLSSQITRAAISIPSNIAEGSSRKSNKDYGRFIEIALGSCFELETHIIVARGLKIGDQKIENKLITTIIEEQKMLSSYALCLKEGP